MESEWTEGYPAGNPSIEGSINPYKACSGRRQNGIYRHVGTQTAFHFINGVDSEGDWILDTAVNKTLHGHREGCRTQYSLCSRRRQLVGDLLLIAVMSTHSTDLVLHFDVTRLVGLIQDKELHTIPKDTKKVSLLQMDPLLPQQID